MLIRPALKPPLYSIVLLLAPIVPHSGPFVKEIFDFPKQAIIDFPKQALFGALIPVYLP